MAKKDVITKLLTKQNDYFADIFNHLLFHKDLIDPDKLSEKDAEQLFPKIDSQKEKELYRDVFKKAVIKYDDKNAYVLFGIENQSEIAYNMPARVMLYDALSYRQQLQQIKYKNRKNNTLSSAEWLSGFSKADRILPVISLVIYWSPKAWDGPRCLHDMFDQLHPLISEYVSNYHVNIFSLHEIPLSSISSMKSDIGLLFEFLKYSNDMAKVRQYRKDKRFSNVPFEIADAIRIMADMKIELRKDQEGNTDMCEGLRLLREQDKAEARAEALIEGKIEGKIETRNESRRIFIDYLMKQGKSKAEAIKEADKVFPFLTEA